MEHNLENATEKELNSQMTYEIAASEMKRKLAMKKLLTFILLTAFLISATACCMANRPSDGEPVASAPDHTSYPDNYITESTEEIQSNDSFEASSSEDVVYSEPDIESNEDSSDTVSVESVEPVEPVEPVNISITDFVGKTVKDVKAQYGYNFIHDYHTGSSIMNYKQEKISFFLGASFLNLDDSYRITGVMSYGDEKVFDKFSGNVTYPQIKAAIGNEVQLAEPDGWFSAIDNMWQYTLDFSYNGMNVVVSWSRDPNTYACYSVYVCSDIEPSQPVPEPDDSAVAPEPDDSSVNPEFNYISIRNHTENDSYSLKIIEQNENMVKVYTVSE